MADRPTSRLDGPSQPSVGPKRGRSGATKQSAGSTVRFAVLAVRGCETTEAGVGVPPPRPPAKGASERLLTHFLPQAIGRRNWSFLGSAEAGPRAAVLFTILAGAKRHRLEPWAYLWDVVLRLCAGETDLESLLPDRWAAQ
jgi:hypothetical protein